MQNFSALLINLDRDTERLAHMQVQLARTNVGFIRQAGILGTNVPERLRALFFNDERTPKNGLTLGEIGCYASHILALERIASGDLGNAVLVMEDDLDLADDFLHSINKALNALPEGWGILRLSNPSRKAYVPLAKIGKDRLLVHYSRIPIGAGAYLITPAAANSFLASGIRGLPFDVDLRYPWVHGMRTFGILPAPAKANMLKSSSDTVGKKRERNTKSSARQRLERGDLAFVFKRAFYNIHDLGLKNWLLCACINIADMLPKKLAHRSVIDLSAKLFRVTNPSP